MDKMKIEFDSSSKNESFARVVVASFLTRLDPTLEEIADISKGMEPLYTSKPDLDRSGMGFSFMEAFMD